MGALNNLVKKACLMAGGLLLACAAEAGEPVTSSFDMEAGGIAYRIFTAAPAEPALEGGYPVVYMVDGNRMLPIAAKRMADDPALRAVFVGIGYPTDDQEKIVRLRYFDLTPPTPESLIPVPSGAPKTGGRDAFFAFIEGRVKPEIEKRFSIDRDRQALFGHSLGGLFTLHALFSHTGAFQTYAAADPSIWWNGGSILADKDRFAAAFKADPHPLRLLIETSGKRGTPPGRSAEEAERLRKLRGGPSGAEIFEELAALPQMDAAFRRFDGETHGSMIPLTVADSLDFILLGKKPEPARN